MRFDDGPTVRSYVRLVGMLASFPWLRLRAPVRAGEFQLIPYVRDEYKGPCAETINLVTAPYREAPDTPIAEAVLLGIEGFAVDADLGEGLDGAFLFSEMVALAGLAKRRFFQHSGYSNRDNYRLIVQGFDEPGKGTLERHRRRDGVRSVYVMAAAHRVRCPAHVQPEHVALDVALLEALVFVRNDEGAANFVDSRTCPLLLRHT